MGEDVYPFGSRGAAATTRQTYDAGRSD